ncbi:anti-sigma factor antagonist [bacterium]|jgi:anti-anti-sigma factor|nr:anti-sigma factor antagonist [bacterium]NBW57969.1 anti-sigma factor antagonist [bacterium]NBX72601.1 anti-sigma factor antagonist [bacterium]
MSIQSTSSADGKTLTIAVKGRFDFSSLQIFRNAYEKVEIKPEHYLVDLKESEYLDSSALGMLLALRDYAGGDTADVKIINCSNDVRKILLITKLDELFDVS